MLAELLPRPLSVEDGVADVESVAFVAEAEGHGVPILVAAAPGLALPLRVALPTLLAALGVALGRRGALRVALGAIVGALARA